MLTDLALRKLKLKPPATEHVVSDYAGLCVRVSPKGNLTFFYRFRVCGKPAPLPLGVFDQTSLREAREKRDAARKLLEQGIDPRQHEWAKKLERQERLRRELSAELVDDLIKAFTRAKPSYKARKLSPHACSRERTRVDIKSSRSI